MKKLILIIGMVLIVGALSAQTENSFKYVIKAKGGITNTLKGLAADKVDSAKVSSGAVKFYQGATVLRSSSNVQPFITVAATDATASEKLQADYLCDGTADEVQWALANTAANGGIVKLLGRTFTIEDNITLTSTFQGIGQQTHINLTTQKQILLHNPGNLKDLLVHALTRTGSIAAVQMEVIDGTTDYDAAMDLLDGVIIYSSSNDGTGLKLYTLGNSGEDFHYISFCTFGDIKITGFGYGMILYGEETAVSNAFITSNTFEHLVLANCDTMMYIKDNGTGGVNANIWNAIHMQHGANTEAGIVLDVGVESHLMENVYAMDWGSVPCLTLGNTTTNNVIWGYLPVISYPNDNSTSQNNIRDISQGTTLPLRATPTISAGICWLHGAGSYLIEGEGAASDYVNEMYGAKDGDFVMLRRATTGQVITITTYVTGVMKEYTLSHARDYVLLYCTATGSYNVVKYYKYLEPRYSGTRISIGHPGDTGCDFYWTSAAGHAAQALDLGAIVPRNCRVIGVEMICTESVVGVTDITLAAGNVSGGAQFIVAASCDDDTETRGIIDATLPAAVGMNNGAATKIWINGDPTDNNWSDMTVGKWEINVSWIEYNHTY